MRKIAALVLLALPALPQERVDLGTVDRIKTEAFESSRVMETLRNLTDVHGPRLTGSPGFEDAARWAMGELNGYGLEKVHLEKWGPFGRAWSLEQSSLELIEPRYSQLTAVPLAWSASTNGPVTAELVLAPLGVSFRNGPKKSKEAWQAYRAKWAGKLRGKIVLLSEPKVPAPQNSPQFRRYTAAELADLANAPAPASKLTAKRLDDLEWPEDPAEMGKFFSSLPNALMEQLYDLSDQTAAERGEFFAREGVAGVLREDERAHEGMLFSEAAGGFKAAGTPAPPTFVVTAEQYNRIARLVDKKSPVRVRLSLKATTSDRDMDGLNIIGEIPGGDKKEEIVMVGAHFDSWHSGTGATDNGAGSAVMIEAMRILKALNLKLDRTVRIGLWGGEEQGLFGSRAYVKEHFADSKTMQVTSEHGKLSGYFNLDNGSGKIRGVYLQGHEAMRPIFESWLAPFRDMGVTTVSIRNTGGTDHLSFAAVGLPGFQFIQDPLDYGTVTHHSNMDTWDHAVPEDLMQASAVIATMVYETATRKEMLPRRPLPKPE
ncbi:MAG TPA: M20/M25/M40 family metallo-hydrolase [Candidatus Acidoferrales bacterium]|jgi:carboxypeptidase Q|nr:M20/M25/M40 family metallo-hydrolase [Candidatus Acidoferrales bacterium]